MSPESTPPATAPPPPRAWWSRLLRRRERSLARGTIVTAASSATTAVVSLALSVALARLLGVAEFGRLASYLAAALSIALFSDVLGFYYATIYLAARDRHGLSPAAVRGTALLYGVVTGSLAGLLVAMTPIRGLLFPLLRDPAWGTVLGAGIAANAALNQARGLLVGQGQFLAVGLLNAGQVLAYAAGAMVATEGAGIRSALAVATAHALASTLLVAIAVAAFAARGLARPSRALLRAGTGVGLRASAVNALGFLHLRVDQYLIPYLLGAEALGLYAVAVQIGEFLTRVPSMTGSVLFPLVAAEADPSRVAGRTLRAAFKAGVVVAVLALPLGIAAPYLIGALYDAPFAAAVPLVRWLLPGMACLSALFLLNNHLAGMGYPLIKIYGLVLALALNVSFNLVLLPRIGARGASIASSLSYAGWMALTVAYFLWLRRRAASSSRAAPGRGPAAEA